MERWLPLAVLKRLLLHLRPAFGQARAGEGASLGLDSCARCVAALVPELRKSGCHMLLAKPCRRGCKARRPPCVCGGMPLHASRCTRRIPAEHPAAAASAASFARPSQNAAHPTPGALHARRTCAGVGACVVRVRCCAAWPAGWRLSERAPLWVRRVAPPSEACSFLARSCSIASGSCRNRARLPDNGRGQSGPSSGCSLPLPPLPGSAPPFSWCVLRVLRVHSARRRRRLAASRRCARLLISSWLRVAAALQLAALRRHQTRMRDAWRIDMRRQPACQVRCRDWRCACKPAAAASTGELRTPSRSAPCPAPPPRARQVDTSGPSIFCRSSQHCSRSHSRCFDRMRLSADKGRCGVLPRSTLDVRCRTGPRSVTVRQSADAA
jgi:hypothetical protein